MHGDKAASHRGKVVRPAFFMYAEDMELCQRTIRAGWRISYDPRFSILHYQGASFQQQEAGIMISSIKSPRYFFLLSHGPLATTAFDILTVTGFAVRWLAYRLAALLRPGRGFEDKAKLSSRYLALAWKVTMEPSPRVL